MLATSRHLCGPHPILAPQPQSPVSWGILCTWLLRVSHITHTPSHQLPHFRPAILRGCQSSFDFLTWRKGVHLSDALFPSFLEQGSLRTRAGEGVTRRLARPLAMTLGCPRGASAQLCEYAGLLSGSWLVCCTAGGGLGVGPRSAWLCGCHQQESFGEKPG